VRNATYLLTNVHQLLLTVLISIVRCRGQQAELIEELCMAGQQLRRAEGVQGYTLQVAQPQPRLLQYITSAEYGQVHC
jgi:hypothetical protein